MQRAGRMRRSAVSPVGGIQQKKSAGHTGTERVGEEREARTDSRRPREGWGRTDHDIAVLDPRESRYPFAVDRDCPVRLAASFWNPGRARGEEDVRDLLAAM